MIVRVGSIYTFHPCMVDIIHCITDLRPGARVRVVNLPGAPKANTMGQCYVADPETGQFIGMVSTSSLHRKGR